MIFISTTSDSEKILKKISLEILKKKLSPCTHIYKIDQSGYIWKNQIIHKEEFKLEIKTNSSNKSDIISIINNNHNYKIYELSESKINSLNLGYNKWFIKQFK